MFYNGDKTFTFVPVYSQMFNSFVDHREMKKVILFFILLVTFSCNDGDLDVSSFEFEDEVNICGTTEYTLYRLSTGEQREALFVTLTDLQIRKDEDLVIPVSVTETGA